MWLILFPVFLVSVPENLPDHFKLPPHHPISCILSQNCTFMYSREK
ncbi:unnamed protein product [Tenebrio molitor]|nr:unnamed protein product [Tenebrio molitor]